MQTGPAQRVTIYVGESHHHHGRSAYMAVFEFLFYHQVAGATVTRGIAGFGPDHHIHTADVLTASANLPIKIEFIESAGQVAALLPRLREMIGDGLISVSPADVYLPPHPAPTPPRPQRLQGPARLLRIFVDEKDHWDGKPLFEALVESLRAHDMAGVTVHRGIAGYGPRALAGQSTGLPVMLTVVESADKIRAYLPLLDTMLQAGLVVLADTEVIQYTHAARGPAPVNGDPA